MRMFNVGDEVLFYQSGRRVYGKLVEYINDDVVAVDIYDEDGDVAKREVIREEFVRDADDPDDPELIN